MNETAPSTSGFTQWLAENRGGSGRALLVVGLAIAGLAVWLIYQSGNWTTGPAALNTDLPLFFTGIYLAWSAVAAIGCGMWQLSKDPPAERRPLYARLVMLILTGVVGAGLFLLGLALLYSWGETLTKLLREGEREGAWRVLVALAALVGGLFILFLGLQSVRADERKVIGIRRYVYGFNAFLTGFLLLAVLIVVNLLFYLKVPASIDATQAGIYTLSEQSKQVLAEIDEPTKIYVILRPSAEVFEDTRSLLDKFKEVSPKLSIEEVSLRDDRTIETLLKKFPRFEGQSQGLLIVVNDDPAKSAFVSARDLTTTEGNPMMGGEVKEKFLGEMKLINELSFLKSGRQMPIVYVTQGFGEPDLNDQSRRGGLGILKDRLQRRNFDVRPLKFEVLNPQIPDDAKIIIVAGPKQTYPQPIADALMAYADKGGKILFMLDVVEVGREAREMPPTGFEGMLAANGVEVTKDQIFNLVIGAGQIALTSEVNAEVDPASANQPIVMPFKNTEFRFVSCRLVRPTTERVNPAIRTQVLLRTEEGIPVFTEADAQADLQQTLNLFVRDRKEAQKRITDKLPIMLAVSETPRSIPGASPPPAEKPKLVVVGDTNFVSNVRADVRAIGVEFDLFIGALEWLRERPNNIGVGPKDYQYFELNRGVVNYIDRMRYLPLLISSIVVFGLGIGVWLVRRQ